MSYQVRAGDTQVVEESNDILAHVPPEATGIGRLAAFTEASLVQRNNAILHTERVCQVPRLAPPGIQ